MQVYDLAWSPTGEYILAGSTDNCARVFTAADGERIVSSIIQSLIGQVGKCVQEIAEHNHYVQGVAWDPLNEYISTQSSDRSMHVYRISTKQGSFEAHAIGKNTRMSFNLTRTPSSQNRGRTTRRESASDAESSANCGDHKEDPSPCNYAPPTPATSVTSTPSTMFPPPSVERSSSRRSSFSGSNAPGSPSHFVRYGRSPSPMLPLPAIRTLPSPAWSTIKLYGDEGFTNFFRRLTFSTDGGLLLTPAGQFEDPSFPPECKKLEDTPTKKNPQSSDNINDPMDSNSGSSVFIYSRANFARPPIAQLPGHKKASVAVRFSPILYELRNGVTGEGFGEPKTANLERNKDGMLAVDILGKASDPLHSYGEKSGSSMTSIPAPAPLPLDTPSAASPLSLPAHHPPNSHTPSQSSKPSTPIVPMLPSAGSVFLLPYRMLYAVLTMDTVAIYDTQQSGPICLLTKLHYDEFTDIAWLVRARDSSILADTGFYLRSPDGQSLILSSRDGYCTIIIFDEILPSHHIQQSTLQLQSIAHHNSVPLTVASTPSSGSSALPVIAPPSLPVKRVESSTTSQNVDDTLPTGDSQQQKPDTAQPPKKKRRIALTRVGDLGA